MGRKVSMSRWRGSRGMGVAGQPIRVGTGAIAACKMVERAGNEVARKKCYIQIGIGKRGAASAINRFRERKCRGTKEETIRADGKLKETTGDQGPRPQTRDGMQLLPLGPGFDPLCTRTVPEWRGPETGTDSLDEPHQLLSPPVEFRVYPTSC